MIVFTRISGVVGSAARRRTDVRSEAHGVLVVQVVDVQYCPGTVAPYEDPDQATTRTSRPRARPNRTQGPKLREPGDRSVEPMVGLGVITVLILSLFHILDAPD